LSIACCTTATCQHPRRELPTQRQAQSGHAHKSRAVGPASGLHSWLVAPW
jgi:hypothetical protein